MKLLLKTERTQLCNAKCLHSSP